MPSRVRSSLAKLGSDVNIARRKRLLTMAMMAERIGVNRETYHRIERGDPTVAIGAYAMTLFVLGLDHRLAELISPGSDDRALLFDDDVLPKRVRSSRKLKKL